MTFVEKLNQLLQENNLTRKKFLEDLHFGKNQFSYWKKEGTQPTQSTMEAIARYFNVPVEYLTEESENRSLSSVIVSDVIEWLEDNEFEVQEDEHSTWCIGKNGEYIYLVESDFITECVNINDDAKDGFGLAMHKWVHTRFDLSTVLTSDEKFVLDTFRNLSSRGKAEMHHFLLTLRDKESSKGENAEVV